MFKEKNISKKNIKHKIPLLGILCFFAVYITVQRAWAEQAYRQQMHSFVTQDSIVNKKDSTPNQVKQIKLLYASILTSRDSLEILIDSVELEHQGAILYCDSAYFNPSANTFEAFGDVVMNQGDSIYLYGEFMEYDGNTQLVKVRRNVKLEHLTGTLFTDSLNYNRVTNIGYYTDGGYLVDSLNTLSSTKGYYEPNKALATFIKDVVLENPNFMLYSDTLLYNTQSQIAEIVSETKIVSDSGIIYGNRGFYNTINEDAILLDQSKVLNKDGSRILLGDSIIYKKGTNDGEVFGHMFLQDTIQQLIIKGNYGIFYGNSDYAFATDSAEMITYSSADSLYLHADTLEMLKFEPIKVLKIQEIPFGNSVVYDSSYVDETPYRMNAFHNVRFYKSDMQGVCDSLVFNTSDSLLRMFKDPILWSENRQLTGDSIQILMNDSTVDKMFIKGNAFSIEEKDSLHYNQLKSRELTIDFLDGKIKRIHAEGNVETITYPEERDGTLNRIQSLMICSFLDIEMNDGAFERMKAWPSPSGRATPFLLLKPEKLRLEYFRWFDYIRPIDRDDIFRKVTMRKDENVRPQIIISEEEE